MGYNITKTHLKHTSFDGPMSVHRVQRLHSVNTGICTSIPCKLISYFNFHISRANLFFSMFSFCFSSFSFSISRFLFSFSLFAISCRALFLSPEVIDEENFPFKITFFFTYSSNNRTLSLFAQFGFRLDIFLFSKVTNINIRTHLVRDSSVV